MRTNWLKASAAALTLAGIGVAVSGMAPSYFHDPRTVAAKLSQGFEIDGVGRFDLNYGALHFNEKNYEGALKNPQMMTYFNGNIWGKLGTAKLGFPVTCGETKIAAGNYDFGINMAADDAFSVVLWQGKDKIELPLEVEKDQKAVGHLVVALMATDVDTVYTLEARCGPYRGTCDLTVPAAPKKTGN